MANISWCPETKELFAATPESVYASKVKECYLRACPHCGHSLLAVKTVEGDLSGYTRKDTDYRQYKEKLSIAPISDVAMQEIEADGGRWMNHPEVTQASKNG